MTRYRIHAATLLVLSFGLIAATPARAASPTKVTADWKGGASLPSDVSMYSYVPAKVAPNPPLLTLVHYCGGSATAVFGQASGIVSAADQYGFVIVVPDNGGRCWDVTSTKTHTRDGGGDSHAIIQMVRYGISQYHANADRVYSTGDSSGAMMTELLLALYPDVYKAGSTFAGVPAGCSNEFDGSGLCGLPAQTAQQWGDRVRAMYPGYSGHRPRVQLFHGDADGTITYKNQAEAIKEWTNVLGLDTNPTSTDTGLTLGSHQATRQRWKDSCGYVVFEAWTSIGGDHGPSDCLFNSNVVPFLGLDQTGDVDPEIQQCGGGGTGGSPGSGGTTSSTGAGGGSGGGGAGGSAAGGTSGTRDGGQGGRDASSTGAGGGLGGATGGGGSSSSGGTQGTGGGQGTGGSGNAGTSGGGGSGSLGTGGTVASGGSGGGGGTQGSGGSQGRGGSQGSGGSPGTGGSGGGPGAGGAVGTGGSSADPGSGGMANSGGAGGTSGSGGSTAGSGSSANGCGCALGGAKSKKHPYRDTVAVALGLGLLTLALKRRRGV
jgi:acetylxylan esterase